MYIAEISPARLRGRLVAVQQFNIVLGCLLAFLSNYLISQANLAGTTGGGCWAWWPSRPRFSSSCCSSSPSRRAGSWPKDGSTRPAAYSASLGSDAGDVEAEVEAIRASLALEHHRVEEPFFRRQYRKPILLAVAIAMFNQLSGVNALWYYTPAIFRMAGAGPRAAMLLPVVAGRGESRLHHAGPCR